MKRYIRSDTNKPRINERYRELLYQPLNDALSQKGFQHMSTELDELGRELIIEFEDEYEPRKWEFFQLAVPFRHLSGQLEQDVDKIINNLAKYQV